MQVAVQQPLEQQVANILAKTVEQYAVRAVRAMKGRSKSAPPPSKKQRKNASKKYQKKKPVKADKKSVSKRTKSSKYQSSAAKGSGAIKMIKAGRKVTKVDSYRVTHKVERGQNFIAFNAIYPGGATHPSYATLRMIALALVRFIAVRAKMDFTSFDDDIGLPFVFPGKWSIFYYWKGEGQTEDDTATFRVAIAADVAVSWSNLATFLADSFVNIFGAKQGRRLYSFGVYPQQDANVGESFIATQYYNASDLYISVKGESSIQMQNRTLGEGTGDKTEATNIFNNPLRGKYYTFKSGRPCIRGINVASSDKTFLFDYQNRSGSIATQDKYSLTGTQSDFPITISDALRKPPNGNFFTNCTTTKYVTVEPGGILKSKIEHTITKSLTNWIYAFTTKFLAVEPPDGFPKTLALMTGSDPTDWRLGVSHCFGLEKMIDTSAALEPEIQVGHEHNLFMVSKCTYKPKNSAVSLISITT